MATQTNWHLDGLVLPEGDPMAQIEQLKSEAVVIQIRDRDAVLADMAQTVRRENGWAAYSELECSIKARHTGRIPPCYGCPEFTADFEHDPMALVCKNGRRQVDLIGELDAIRAVEELDALLLNTYERDVASCEELAAVLL